MAYGWTDPSYAGGSARLDTAIVAIQQILPIARSKNVSVIYTTSPFPQTQIKSAADFFRDIASGISVPVKSTTGQAAAGRIYRLQGTRERLASTPLIGHLLGRRSILCSSPAAQPAPASATATDAKSNQMKTHRHSRSGPGPLRSSARVYSAGSAVKIRRCRRPRKHHWSTLRGLG
jgi:hypothetical protein